MTIELFSIVNRLVNRLEIKLNIGSIKGIVLLLQNVSRMYQYVLELVEGLDNLLANLS